jgi:hypothetical protein
MPCSLMCRCQSSQRIYSRYLYSTEVSSNMGGRGGVCDQSYERSNRKLAFQPSLPLPYLRTTFLPCSTYCFTLKTEVARSSERSGTICKTTRSHIQEDSDVYTRTSAGIVGRRGETRLLRSLLVSAAVSSEP